MIHLIYIEILKLRRNIPFLILLALFAVSAFGVCHVVKGMGEEQAQIQKILPFTFPGVWHSVSFIMSFLLAIPALALIMHTCAEYTYRTNRQNVINGLSRDQYVTGKVLLVVLLSLLSSLVAFAVTALVGDDVATPFSFAGIKYIGYLFLHAMMFLGVALLLSLLLRRSAITIGILAIYALLAENVLERFTRELGSWGHLLPLASSEHLLELPAYRIVRAGAGLSEQVFLIAAIAYVVACYVACYWKYRRQNL